MDYIFGSALSHYKGLPLCIIGYDIACQWFGHIHERSSEHWPDKIKLDDSTELVPVIGKFHAPVHREDGHEQYSCNLAPNVGLTDFEACERTWGIHNTLGNSTKTMGPGTRGDTLEAHFGFHNWQKYTGTGKCVYIYVSSLRVTSIRSYLMESISRNLEGQESTVRGPSGINEQSTKRSRRGMGESLCSLGESSIPEREGSRRIEPG